VELARIRQATITSNFLILLTYESNRWLTSYYLQLLLFAVKIHGEWAKHGN
jgi:hypothetical protein